MFRRSALCLALALPGLHAAKPRPRPAPKVAADPAVPAAGAIGERVDPGTGRGRAVGPFLEPRTDYQATALPDGRVLVTGGSARTATSEWYDPAANAFRPGPALTRPRQGHRALLLKDGRLLLLGGTDHAAPAEVLEPGATAFKPLPEAAFGLWADGIGLADGRVLLLDGASGGLFLWDGRKAPSAKGTLAYPRNFARLVRLQDGRVAITGGWAAERKAPRRNGRPTAAPPVQDLPIEIFNPRWSSLSTCSFKLLARARHQAALLPDGRFVLWGGVGLDPDAAVEDLELVDLAKETVLRTGRLDLKGGPCPAFALDADGKGYFLAERAQAVLAAPDALPTAGASGVSSARLANGYLSPTLVPLAGGGLLVLGTAAYGAPLDRWDARTRQGAVVGTLRQGTEDLALLPDGSVLALGPVVDLLDPRTGALTPVGWREDLAALLKTTRPVAPVPGLPPFTRGSERPDAALVVLDKTRALVVEGAEGGTPSGRLDLWDLRKRTLSPVGTLKTRRAKPSALKLNDGSVLVWGLGVE